MSVAVTEQAIPGGWSDREVTIGPHRFSMRIPTDPDAVLELLESPGATTQPHLADPYWAKLWPAAPLLAAAIVRNPPPRGTHVLELGCGSGLVGIAALACGLEVTFSDYVPLAVDLALENAQRNGFSNGRRIVIDWRNPTASDRFPFIVAADVIYDRTNTDPLLNAIDHYLAPGGTVWLGDAGRGPATEFVIRARDRGWHIALFDENDQPLSAPVLSKLQRFALTRP